MGPPKGLLQPTWGFSVFTSPAMHYHYPYAFSDPNAPPSSNGPLRSSGGPPDMSRSMGPLPGPTRRPGGGPGKSTGFQPVSFPIQTSYQEPPRMVRQAQSAYFPSGVPAPYPSSQPRARPATFHESSWTNNQGMWPLQGGAPHGAQPSHSAHSAPQSPAEPALPDLNFEFFTTVEPSSKMFPEANPNFSQKVCRFFRRDRTKKALNAVTVTNLVLLKSFDTLILLAPSVGTMWLATNADGES